MLPSGPLLETLMRRHTSLVPSLVLASFFISGAASAQLVPLGAGFRVNATTAGNQDLASVASSPDGTFVVVWQSEGAPGDPSVRAQRYDRTGLPQGGEIVVSTSPPVFHLATLLARATGAGRLSPSFAGPFSAPPQVAVHAGGDFLVVWAGPAGAIDIRARLIRRTGTPAGPDFVVNTSNLGEESLPVVTAVANGFVVAWTDPAFSKIHGRLLDRNAQPASAELDIAGAVPGKRFGAVLAPGAHGGFVAAWTGEGAGESDLGTFARLFDAQGSALGPAFLVNTTVEAPQTASSVASDAAGNFLVTFVSGDSTLPPADLDALAQRFASDGQRVGGELRVHAAPAGTQSHGRAALDETGGAAVVWQSATGSPATSGLFAKLYASAGPALTNEVPLDLAGTDSPALAADFGGDFVAVATGTDGASSTGIFARRFTRACEVRGHNLCLQNGRFKVEAAWRTNPTENGLGFAQALTADTGYFYFFNPNNVELVVKVLNGCPVNNRFWVFAGGLTNVEVDLIVTDTETGAIRRYVNPANTPYQPIQDTSAFATCAAPVTADASPGLDDEAAAPPTMDEAARQEARLERRELRRLLTRLDAAVESARSAELVSRAAAGACTPSATRLCLRSGRFAITVDWTRPDGIAGDGRGIPLTSDTGYFWFFNPANVEMLIKVLNGCPVNNRYWVFAGGLTNVRAEITVTDTSTGAQKTYVNPVQTPFQPILDTGAFATCP